MNQNSKNQSNFETISGNEATARTAYMLTEAASIYPITPSSDMAEYCDQWSAKGKTNIFGTVPSVIEMQSEAGAAGTLHGLMLGGTLGSTFTASQGLLLMIPNLYKMVGELLPAVVHVAARTIATHALSIFGDHSDVYACRATGIAMLASNSVQENADLSLISHLSAIEASYPFMHFFDGFRTSHEFNKIQIPEVSIAEKLINKKALAKFRERAMNPDKPKMYGTAENSDTFFQHREAANTYINAIPCIVEKYMQQFAKLTGRQYHLFDYVGAPDAEHVIIAMGSACETIADTLTKLNGKLGLIKVRLYRPFSAEHLLKVLPKTTKTITVLDRTKENGAVGDPLYLDVSAVVRDKVIIAGRYGVSSKEFTPDMVASIYQNAATKQPKNHFTIGINDDVTHTSLPVIPRPDLHHEGGCRFYGLGSDGTVGANKNSCAIIGDNTNLYSQAYFVYDSKKSGGTTISHLRFDKHPIHAPYLVTHPEFVACHNQTFLTKFDMLNGITDGGTFLLNTTYSAEQIDDILPNDVKRTLSERKINFYIINAYQIAKELGLGVRINTIMQTAFFKLINLIDYQEIKTLLKKAIEKSYGKKGPDIVEMNNRAVDSADTALLKIDVDKLTITTTKNKAKKLTMIETINSLAGDTLPVSAFSPDGSAPTATTQYEKRDIATSLPHWIPENCIQCNRCAMVCPHATIRPVLTNQQTPKDFTTIKSLGVPGYENYQYRVQISPQDCTGCGACAKVCPAKNKALVMRSFEDVHEDANYQFSLTLPETPTAPNNVKLTQFNRPLFEFSGACAGCGETPYIKLLTQLYGDKLVIANATGCSSIYGGSSPSCPYAKNNAGKGPAWANSLFEDNAEFGFGLRKALNIRGETDKVVWIIGGDGWAYDIGFGGLDHVLSSQETIN
ncbi:MAG: pyruvate:ferredoxin (flavodoxin) oxidoreductase, partial [Clostridia bacterium]|nr:pyruvate:ferredoxin (flavodoxin) oxidoreductase [Clostridia bacterium]